MPATPLDNTSSILGNVTPDYESIKAKQKSAWETGDYSAVGVTLQIILESLAIDR